jgi:hypothetical protein
MISGSAECKMLPVVPNGPVTQMASSISSGSIEATRPRYSSGTASRDTVLVEGANKECLRVGLHKLGGRRFARIPREHGGKFVENPMVVRNEARGRMLHPLISFVVHVRKHIPTQETPDRLARSRWQAAG